MTKQYTDVIFQKIKLYIEGVQVPFISISISSGIGGLPSASITVPPQAGLMDIARFYSPKVHVFFDDRTSDYDPRDPDEAKDAYKLLFSGVIAGVSYFKSKNISASTGINFQCVHRYNFINEMIVDYTGWLTADPNAIGDSTGVMADTANSRSTVIEALAGIKDPKKPGGTEITLENPKGQTNILPARYKEYYTRLLGMPGVLMNFWNQMKRSSFNTALRQGDKYYSEAFLKIYQPLIEDGLQFFDRISGHYTVEARVQADSHRVDPCPETPGVKEKIVIPPSYQMFLASSVQAEMAISNVASYLQNSGELTTIYQIFASFYDSIDYEMITLASPAEVAIRPEAVFSESDAQQFLQAGGVVRSTKTKAIDTIVKPKLPYYFSPTCNVLFPGMYHTVNVSYDEFNIPTRVSLKNVEGPNDNGFRTSFRAPHSIREAIARKVAGTNGVGGYVQNAPYSLKSTLGQSYGAIGHYEQGRGIKQERIDLPRWLSHYSQSTYGGSQPSKDVPPDANQEKARVDALNQLAKGWSMRYPGEDRSKLNPYNIKDTDVSAHHRLLFSAADYYYTQVFARSKAGSVEGPFNPFIVPGYPMDVLEINPLSPSFHGMCVGVTHNFSAESCSTSIQMAGVMTYAELANYYVPFASPLLQVALGLAEKPTLTDPGEMAVKAASDFYAFTLGVPAVTPSQLIDFASMKLKPQKWAEKGNTWEMGSPKPIRASNGGELNPMLTFEGNLSLVYRPIESLKDIEDRFKIKFIDMSPVNYNSTVIRYKDPQLDDTNKFEIGRSQFLTYDTYFNTPTPSVRATPQPSTSTDVTQQNGTVQRKGL